MTQIEQQKKAKEFSEFWKDKGDEKQESQRFWIDLLQNVFGVTNPAKYIEFEKRVLLSHTSYIDAYIADTKVLIEQKGIKIDLHKAYEQSDGTFLTPFEQAKRYVSEMKASEKPRWIIVCNFAEFLVYDLEIPHGEPQQIFLKDFQKEFYRLQFLVDEKNENIRREEEISIEAGKLVDKLYESLLPQYKNQDEKSLRSLNILCVRLVFCLYAEKAGLFATRTSFVDYIKSFNLPNVRNGLKNLFKALDTKKQDRDEYDESITPFPYVNGGLFKDENIEIPNFTQEIVDVIVNYCAAFDWREISPTIFGAVFESTLNPETRRKGGMHYTSIQNIHKVIDPLFLNSLNAEFESIKSITNEKQKIRKLNEFEEKLGSLCFLDPACGSGNFLTETFIALRRLENKVISELNGEGNLFDVDSAIHVKISQFYGIEINDFAVTVAKTALWIAESQMINETEEILSKEIDFLPLKTNAFIVEGNALRMDWSTLRSDEAEDKNELSLFSGFTTQVDGTKHEYDYIMGNPPFVGYAYQSKEQKEDLHQISKDIANNIDYVAGWYFKAALLIKGTNTKAAFVSTNSITQGEQVAVLWKPLFEKYNVQLDFAYRTFRWDSESTEKAHVHCVIVGFECHTDSILLPQNQKQSKNQNKTGISLEIPNPCGNIKKIYNADGTIEEAENINGYLLNAPTIFIDKNSKPLCEVPPMIRGSSPIDDGNFILTIEEKEEYIKKEPQGEKFLRPFMMGKDFIDRKPRFCFWLVGANPSEFRKCPILMNRIEAVRNFRLKSSKAATVQSAETPTIFGEMRPCESDYIAIPKVSSEQRRYIPMDYLPAEILAGDKLFQMPNASLYHFGVLTSNIHMAWMRAVCGRLKSDYNYSNTIVYNNFPWCNPTDEQKAKIEKTAQAILDARALFPDASLADLYDELGMPPELRKAHRENDKAVMAAYGFKKDMTEAEIVGELFKLYEKLTSEGKQN
ncbi:MAG: SAM-dependent DNA methyltransferase [Treponema sp.]|nr:SAM-dependent DNA methyltransferase [Treponema sp.]